MRKAFADGLVEAARRDPRLIFLTGDLGYGTFDGFVAEFGPRYVNVGVAEAQMIAAAAGLALEGWRPIAYSIASFATARAFEQTRFCVGYHGLPVVVVGAGRGLTYATSGVSHHALDDAALMGAIPGMTVVMPGDANEVRALLPQVLALDGPAYFTIGKYGEPEFEAAGPAVLGRGRLVRPGQRVAILTTGEIVTEAVAAADALAAESCAPALWQFHTVKPLDEDALAQACYTASQLLVVEEHVPRGGLWDAVCAWAARTGTAVRVARLGVPDAFLLGNVERARLRQRLGLDAAGIAATVRQLWRCS
jgi:transketolase